MSSTFNNTITQLLTTTPNHADNFNNINSKLLENTKHNKENIDNLSVKISEVESNNRQINSQISSLVDKDNEFTSQIRTINNKNREFDNQISSLTNKNSELLSKINVLSTDRGYKDTKRVPNDTDFNTITDNGIYWANAWVHKNIPTLQDGTRLNGVAHVMQADGVVYQFFHSNKGKWYREKYSTEWTSWQQLATTTKTDISFPFTGSYMSRGGYVSKVTKDAMGLVTINVTFQINDGSTPLPQGNNIIGTLPVGYRPQGIVAGVGSTAFGGTMVNVRVTVDRDGVVICTTGNGYTGSNVIGFSISYYV